MIDYLLKLVNRHAKQNNSVNALMGGTQSMPGQYAHKIRVSSQYRKPVVFSHSVLAYVNVRFTNRPVNALTDHTARGSAVSRKELFDDGSKFIISYHSRTTKELTTFEPYNNFSATPRQIQS